MSHGQAAKPLTSTEWLICIIAAIGFLFDTYELLMAPLITKPALEQLLQVDAKSAVFASWRGVLFWVPPLTGGFFGLFGGYFTDVIGRRRMLVWSIGLYAVSAFLAGFSPNVWVLLFLRCTTMIGVCVEFVAAVAWLSELFPDPKRREAVLGYTQVFGSFGGLLVALVYGQLNKYVDLLPAIGSGSPVWRYTLMSGLLPALPLILVRPFLPESPAWKQKKEAGTLKRPGLGQIFAPQLRRATILSGILFACTIGGAFGAIQQGPDLASQHPSMAKASDKEKTALRGVVQRNQEIGGLLGRLAMAVLLTRIASRRRVLQYFLLPACIVTPLVYLLPGWNQLDLFTWAVFLPGFFIIAQLSFWGNYLPAIYPVHLRGTGESFAANIGGRMVGASAAFVTSTLALMVISGEKLGLSTASAVVGGAIAVFALLASFFLVEPSAAQE
jgi:Sugar (and other) transporter